jgi:predicted nucleic acid-binding protein
MKEKRTNNLKIYLDTSVISFYFADDAPDFRDVTIDFFDNVSKNYDLYISDIVILEINKNRENDLKRKLLDITERADISLLSGNDEINNIAKSYIESGIIPVKKFEDALHIAYATYYRIDVLLSWNFMHLANVNKEILIM